MKNLLIAVCLLASVCAVGQVFPAPPPYPASAGLCQVSDSNHNWTAGACSGATATNFSALVADSANTSTGTFTIGAGTALTYTGTGSINASKIIGTAITALLGNSGKLVQGTGTFTSGNLTATDANGNLVDAGGTFASRAPLASPTFTGIPAAPTAAPGTNTTQVATTAFVTAAVAASGAGTTTNALTINNSGAGDVSGSTFNGSAAKTISYNSIGAQQALTLTTTGTSGAATLVGGTLNIPQYTGGGSGTVNSGSQYQIGYYAANGTAISGNTGIVTDASNNLSTTGTVTSGSGGGVSGKWTGYGSTSGSASISVAAVAGTPSTWLMPTTDPTNGQFLQAGTPSAGSVQLSWVSQTGGGNVSNVGTPTNGQIAQWTGATTIQGLATTGSGNAVLATSPSLTTPTLGVASATSINKMAITAPATSSTLAVADGKTLTASNTLTLTGTDSSSIAFGVGGTVAYTVASGTSAMGTSAISSGTCATVVTTTATGTATTDTITYTPNADPTGISGYAVSATGSLYIWAYPTANNVNFKVCNNTSGSLTPGALTLNWRVTR